MPNFELAIQEFARVLKPGGLLAATVWQSDDNVPFFKVTKDLAAGGPRAVSSWAPELRASAGVLHLTMLPHSLTITCTLCLVAAVPSLPPQLQSMTCSWQAPPPPPPPRALATQPPCWRLLETRGWRAWSAGSCSWRSP